MRKFYIILLLVICAAVPAVAQEKGHLTPEQRKEFREYKMKFLAQEMEIKDDTKSKFFDLYNQLSDERHKIRHEIKDINRRIKDNTATEADYSRLNKLKDQEAELDKKYDAKFETFLSGKEIFKMKQAENKFRQKLQEMKKKKDKKR